MPAPARFPLAARCIQAVAVLLARPVARFCLQVQVRGRSYVPRGGCILAANHRSFFDPPAVGIFLDQPIVYFARASLWRSAFIRFLLDSYLGIPVDRDNPQHSTMSGAIDRLRRGCPVLVFPEGTRSRDGRLGTLRAGPALFARRAKVPIVPIYLHRTELVWPNRGGGLPRLWECRVGILIGRPVPPPPAALPAKLHDAFATRYVQRWMERQERRFRPPLPTPAAAARTSA